MCMVFGIRTSALGCGSGSPLFHLLLPLSVSKRRMWCRRRRLLFGSRLLVSLLRPPLVLIVRVVLLCWPGHLVSWLVLGLTRMVVFSCVSSLVVVRCFVSLLCMLPTATQIVMISLTVSSKMDVSVPTILCGDFNCVLDRSVDRRWVAQDDYSQESVRALSALLDTAAVTDVCRYLHPSSSSFTWSRWDGTAASRIDLIGCPYAWLSQVSSSDIHPCPFSDHCAISVVFSITEAAQPGPGVWKLNTSILDDAEYVELISTFWGRWRQAQRGYPSLVKW